MEVSAVAWWVTLGVTAGVLVFDVIVIGRRPHVPSMKECAAYIAMYTTLAVLFGLWILLQYGGRYAGEFYAGWLTEYSLWSTTSSSSSSS